MFIEQADETKRAKFAMTLEKLVDSYSRRNVDFIVNAHSEYVGSVTLIVTGKKGSAQKNFVVCYNQTDQIWEAFSDGLIYKLMSLTEISGILKNKITNLSTVLTKI